MEARCAHVWTQCDWKPKPYLWLYRRTVINQNRESRVQEQWSTIQFLNCWNWNLKPLFEATIKHCWEIKFTVESQNLTFGYNIDCNNPYSRVQRVQEQWSTIQFMWIGEIEIWNRCLKSKSNIAEELLINKIYRVKVE